jgi:pimeloyl-ACP methyl ester carboxylesterase
MIERFYLMNNMRGRSADDAIGLRQFDIGDAPGFLSRVTVPTLVLWAKGSFLPSSEADRYQAYLTAAPVRVTLVEKLGHMFASDDPALTAGIFDRFAQAALAGRWPQAWDEREGAE